MTGRISNIRPKYKSNFIASIQNQINHQLNKIDSMLANKDNAEIAFPAEKEYKLWVQDLTLTLNALKNTPDELIDENNEQDRSCDIRPGEEGGEREAVHVPSRLQRT